MERYFLALIRKGAVPEPEEVCYPTEEQEEVENGAAEERERRGGGDLAKAELPESVKRKRREVVSPVERSSSINSRWVVCRIVTIP